MPATAPAPTRRPRTLNARGRHAAAWAVVLLGLAAGRAPAGCLQGTLADELTADRLGLERDWLVQVPFDSSGYGVSHVVVGDDLVIVQTGDGGVHAISATDGSAGEPCRGAVLWSAHVATGGQPVPPAGIGRDLVAVTGGRGIVGLERRTGAVRWEHRLQGSPIGGTLVLGDWVYQPEGASSIVRLPANPLGKPASVVAAQVAAKAKREKAKGKTQTARTKRGDDTAASREPLSLKAGGIIDLAPQAFEDGLAWVTRDGLLVALEEDQSGWQRAEFDLVSTPAGPLAIADKAIFAATTAADLARIDSSVIGGGGLRLGWHVRLDNTPDDGPFLVGDVVVVSLGEAGMRGFSAAAGDLVWETCVPGTIVAGCAGRIWFLDRAGRLASLDAATGAPRDLVCLGGFSVAAPSRVADRLILASPDGVLVALSPRGTAARRAAAAREALPTPTPAAPTPEPPAPESPFDTPPETEPDEAMTGEDALAKPEEEDPFAAPGDR
jgi:outer membrane protein assembly factor BamB